MDLFDDDAEQSLFLVEVEGGDHVQGLRGSIMLNTAADQQRSMIASGWA